MDRKLIEVYGDTVHLNNGMHMDGGILEDKEWQSWWTLLTAVPSKRYDVPKGPVGRRFIETYTQLVD
eukprot:9155723-Ditylum_brightwellii.AAC.1